ncbi:MAG: diguanylate cyclase [Terriglobales bacterium]
MRLARKFWIPDLGRVPKWEYLPTLAPTPATRDNLSGRSARTLSVAKLTLKTLKSLCVPGAPLLLCSAAVVETGWFSLPVVQFYLYAVFVAGALLAWRFHSSRNLFALIALLLAYRAMQFFSPGRPVLLGPGRIALEAASFLIPLNLIFASLIRERGLALPSLAPHIGVLFFESVFVAMICRPGQLSGPAMIHHPIIRSAGSHFTTLPQLSEIAFVTALIVLLVRFFLYRKPLESGLLWAAGAAFLGLQAGGINKAGTIYLGTSGLILLSAIIENTYALAYQDELTGLPSRRAFNEALVALPDLYSIAAVDIDHFKTFNDTYGHETGDQVLRLVAGKLAAVGGGGRAFRVGGEEFSILFPGKTVKDVLEQLETLRAAIEASRFHLRSVSERRAEPRGLDRRDAIPQKSAKPAKRKRPDHKSEPAFSVTVSIGVAAPNSTSKTRDVDQVIRFADKALYRAKRAGRNRVEVFSSPRPRSPRGTGRSIAS